MDFKLVSEFQPSGDQPQAIAQLVDAFNAGVQYNTLLGVTGSGKTFTMANVIEQLKRPTLVLSHNKTLAAQLYNEFRNFFPENAVEYFVSYYDYYQPEAYLPTADIYIEKDLSINDEIEKMRLSATASLLSGRRDVIVVSSVSCLYGIGNPEDFHANSVDLKVGDRIKFNAFLRRLVDALYTRTEYVLTPSSFRVRGDTIDIMASFGERCYRISFFDDEIEDIWLIDFITGQRLEHLDQIRLFPATNFITTKERVNRAIEQISIDLDQQIALFESDGRQVEAQRIKQRVEYDMEMMRELGYCSGIENYSRYFDGREAGTRPFCLLDYFPEDFLLIVDESHVTLPQVKAMHGGDHARKENLVEYGFRLPAARDNRPLHFEEFEALTGQTLYVSATPDDYELAQSDGLFVEQIIRPTGVPDPIIEIRPKKFQIDDVREEIDKCIERGDKVLITTITKRLAEEASRYFDRTGIRNRYIHSDIDTLERVQIIDDLHKDRFDVLVGVNLLREGLDLPEVSLVIIFDADSEGFLRSKRSIIQIAGRAARNVNGRVIMYASTVTDSMVEAIEECSYHREKQVRYNIEQGLIPSGAQKATTGQNLLLEEKSSEEDVVIPLVENHYAEPAMAADVGKEYTSLESINRLLEQAKNDMERAAKNLDFVAAARYREQMYKAQQMKEKMLQ